MYSPVSACDLAALASAYGWRRAANAPPPPEGVAVVIQLLRLNPAFGLHNLILKYYAEERLVQAPPFAALPVVRVDLRYFWAGLGGGVTYADGSELEWFTDGSNLFSAGGPWQARIDGRTYVQTSGAMLDAALSLLEGRTRPLGEPRLSTCRDFEDNFLDLAYP